MREYCESTCGDQQWEHLAGTYGSPCDSNIWSASFWLADQDHHDDHHDDHYDDHHGNDGPGQLWTILMTSSISNVSCAFKS